MEVTSSRSFDVVIIGAGIAGLYTAKRLLEISSNSGQILRIKIIEARDRCGGRTETTDGCDLGGQWIGPKHHNMLKLVDEYGLTLIEQRFSNATSLTASCKFVELLNTIIQPLDYQQEIEMNNFMTWIQSQCESFDLHEPWRHPDADILDSLTVSEYLQRFVESNIVRTEIEIFIQTVLACDPRDISMLFCLFYIASGGGMEALGDGPNGAQKWKVKGGSQQISDYLLSQILNQSSGNVSCEFSCCTNKITYDSGAGKFSVYSKSNNMAILATQTLTIADQVVIAIAPYLVSRNIEFDPPLPIEKKALCDSYSMGICVKVIIAYRDAFWDLSEDTQKEVTHDNLLKFYAHNVFSGSFNNFPALILLVTGGAAKSFNSLSSDQQREALFQQLEFMYNCQSSGLARNPVAYLHKNWCEETFSGGCFAGILGKSVLTSSAGRFFRTPTHERIRWASTETATSFYGYMEGAALSGLRAAEECCKYLKLEGGKKGEISLE